MATTMDIPWSLPQAPKAATIPPVTDVTPSDEDLIEGVGRRDATAFETLYRRYSRTVLGLAMRRLGDRGRAEDAVQETFTSIWRAAHTYRRERGPAGAWLFAVARNSISDRGRARREPPAEAPDEPSPEGGPDEQAEQGWVAWRVHSALDVLPEHERELIELAYWSELSQSEIAELVGIPLGTVKTRTRSALARLADQLEEELR
jgi:RNA polymerase sigma-70 factor, ECF subfamily